MNLRGDNPATTADRAGDSDYEAEAKSPRSLADGGTVKGSSKEGNALRKELGVITYNFDKKDQVRSLFMCFKLKEVFTSNFSSGFSAVVRQDPVARPYYLDPPRHPTHFSAQNFELSIQLSTLPWGRSMLSLITPCKL